MATPSSHAHMHAMELPQWTPVDQDIIENLLLVEPHPYIHANVVTPEPYTDARQQLYTPQQDASLRYISGGASYTNVDELRKAKHREVQRRFMLRKKEQIKRTKQLVKDLEMRHNVLALSAETATLQSEHAALSTQLAACGSNSPVLTKAQVDIILAHQMQLVHEHYEPLSAIEWHSLLQKNLDDYDAICKEPNFVSTGATVLGWTDKRKRDGATLKFVMTKAFAHLEAADAMNTTWSKLWLPETHTKLFNSAVTIKIQILQEINDDTVVLSRAFFNPQTNSVVHAVETMCRLQHGRDCIVFLRSPDRMAVQASVYAQLHWVTIWTSLVFTPAARRHAGGTSGCVLRYGGAMHDFAPADIRYWLLEMLYVLLRFECVMIAPVFALLPSQSDNDSDTSSAVSSSPYASSE